MLELGPVSRPRRVEVLLSLDFSETVEVELPTASCGWSDVVSARRAIAWWKGLRAPHKRAQILVPEVMWEQLGESLAVLDDERILSIRPARYNICLNVRIPFVARCDELEGFCDEVGGSVVVGSVRGHWMGMKR